MTVINFEKAKKERESARMPEPVDIQQTLVDLAYSTRDDVVTKVGTLYLQNDPAFRTLPESEKVRQTARETLAVLQKAVDFMQTRIAKLA
jgi:hypothetical protein